MRRSVEDGLVMSGSYPQWETASNIEHSFYRPIGLDLSGWSVRVSALPFFLRSPLHVR